MLAEFTTLIIGFSVFGAAVLLFAYVFFLENMRKTSFARLSCAALLTALAALQLEHLRHIQTGIDLFESKIYLLLLLAIPPAFYFFSKEILMPDGRKSIAELLHLLPLLLGFVLHPNIAAPVAFVIGTGYAFWFTQIVYRMGQQRSRFKFEMFFFGLFAILAVLVLILGLSIPYIEHAVFFISYANFTGIALLLVVAALIVFPELLSDISDAAQLAYASSTLNDVDVDKMIGRLVALMNDDKIFQNENLSLPLLAETMELSSHQLSELVNTRFGCGFSRYIREHRIAEAKRLLREDARSSVLAISLMTGFSSQSNFYAAFREITGEAPGNYRKRHQAK